MPSTDLHVWVCHSGLPTTTTAEKMSLQDFCEQRNFEWIMPTDTSADAGASATASASATSLTQEELDKYVFVNQGEKLGWGLFARKDIAKDELIGFYEGHHKKIHNQQGSSYSLVIEEFSDVADASASMAEKSFDSVDAEKAGEKTRFIQHAPEALTLDYHTRDPENLIAKANVKHEIVETSQGVKKLKLSANRNIKAGKIICMDYGYFYARALGDNLAYFNPHGEITTAAEPIIMHSAELKDCLSACNDLDTPKAEAAAKAACTSRNYPTVLASDPEQALAYLTIKPLFKALIIGLEKKGDEFTGELNEFIADIPNMDITQTLKLSEETNMSMLLLCVTEHFGLTVSANQTTPPTHQRVEEALAFLAHTGPFYKYATSQNDAVGAEIDVMRANITRQVQQQRQRSRVRPTGAGAGAARASTLEDPIARGKQRLADWTAKSWDFDNRGQRFFINTTKPADAKRIFKVLRSRSNVKSDVKGSTVSVPLSRLERARRYR